MKIVWGNHLGNYNHFMQQTQAEIGFIPLIDLKLYTGPEKSGILSLI